MTLETGAAIKITTDDAFMEKCTKDILWVDYKNINKVLKPGKRMYIDDGLISVVAKEMGKSKVTLPGVDSLWGYCTFIPAD